MQSQVSVNSGKNDSENERRRLECVAAHDLFDGFAEVIDGNLKLDLKGIENLRRHIGELFFLNIGKEVNVPSFQCATFSQNQIQDLDNILRQTYEKALSETYGYSEEDLFGHKSILNGFRQLSKIDKAVVVFIFDHSLIEEFFHKSYMRLG